ncbi:MAG: sugar ABC transporter ATP-binding protein [Alsobacter sp.]
MQIADATRQRPVVTVRQAVKSYGTTRALSGVDLDIFAGEVFGVVGHNGAGKSTLMRVLTGLTSVDSGQVDIAGRTEPGPEGYPGVRMAFQEGSLAPELTVKENVFLSSSRCFPRWRWHGSASDAAARTLDEIFPGHAIGPDDFVDDLALADRQRVEIARAAISVGLRLLILDEPTESLSGDAVVNLYNYVRKLRAQGVAIVLVSHRLKEVLSVCDRVAVMKDGAVVALHRGADVTEHDLFVAMGGEEASSQEQDSKPSAEEQTGRTPAVCLPMKTVDGAESAIVASTGEVVGLAGIAGQGQEDVLQRLWRARAGEGGPGGTRAYVPGDRQRSGIFPLWDVARNLTITALPGLARNGVRQIGRETALVKTWVNRLQIRGGAQAAITELSGGNQQKVIVARAFASSAGTILLDDPFRGVDVHTKGELYQLIRTEAEKGRIIIWYSSENAEMQHCDRVYVLRAGRIAGELQRQGITDERIIAMSFKEAGAPSR